MLVLLNEGTVRDKKKFKRCLTGHQKVYIGRWWDIVPKLRNTELGYRKMDLIPFIVICDLKNLTTISEVVTKLRVV